MKKIALLSSLLVAGLSTAARAECSFCTYLDLMQQFEAARQKTAEAKAESQRRAILEKAKAQIHEESVAKVRGFFGLLPTKNPKTLTGVVRFEIEGAGEWTVKADQGKLMVTTDTLQAADVTIRTTAEELAKVVSGEQNLTAAYMAGKLQIKGDMGVALKASRLFS